MENSDKYDVLFSKFVSAVAKDNVASGNYGPFGSAESVRAGALEDAQDFAEEFKEWLEDAEAERELGRPFEDWRRMIAKLMEDYDLGENVKALMDENPAAFKQMLLYIG